MQPKTKIIRDRRIWAAIYRLYWRKQQAGRNLEVLASGNPEKIARRGKNILLGRLLLKLKIWR